MNFIGFAKLCEAGGLRAEMRSPDHWQILGGKFLVNFYPFGKKGPTVYVACTKEGIRADYDEAIRFANELPKIESVDRKKNGYTRHLEWLFRRSNICCHCQKVVARQDGSVEHIVPLSRGGLNNRNNYALAHKKCNNEIGNKV